MLLSLWFGINVVVGASEWSSTIPCRVRILSTKKMKMNLLPPCERCISLYFIFHTRLYCEHKARIVLTIVLRKEDPNHRELPWVVSKSRRKSVVIQLEITFQVSEWEVGRMAE